MTKILVVDDEEDILELAEELFGMAGFDVVTADHAGKAIEVLKEGGIDAIVSDLVMPDMTGQEFFRKLKEENLLVRPFIFVTGFVDVQEDAVALEKEGVDKVFLKPIQVYEIADFINQALAT